MRRFMDLVEANKQRNEERRRENRKSLLIGGLILAVAYVATRPKTTIEFSEDD